MQTTLIILYLVISVPNFNLPDSLTEFNLHTLKQMYYISLNSWKQFALVVPKLVKDIQEICSPNLLFIRVFYLYDSATFLLSFQNYQICR